MKPLKGCITVFAAAIITVLLMHFAARCALGLPLIASAQDNTPAFSAWVECVLRGPYEGMATAQIAYRYDGEFPLPAEDSRYFGDTETGNTIIRPFQVEPGEHLNAFQINVGAQKVVTWKIILFSQLHVVTAWDNPEVKDCPWVTPEPTMEAQPDA